MSFSQEYIFASSIVVVLLALAGYYGWRQWKVLRSLRGQDNLSAEDRRYHRAQAWRRLVSCGFMLVLAGMLVGRYWLGQEQHALEQILPEKAVGTGEQPSPPSPEQQRSFDEYRLFWTIFILIFLGWLCLTFFDLWAIRQFGLRHLRQIQAERQAMIETQAARLRQQRDGHEGNGY